MHLLDRFRRKGLAPDVVASALAMMACGAPFASAHETLLGDDADKVRDRLRTELQSLRISAVEAAILAGIQHEGARESVRDYFMGFVACLYGLSLDRPVIPSDAVMAPEVSRAFVDAVRYQLDVAHDEELAQGMYYLPAPDLLVDRLRHYANDGRDIESFVKHLGVVFARHFEVPPQTRLRLVMLAPLEFSTAYREAISFLRGTSIT